MQEDLENLSGGHIQEILDYYLDNALSLVLNNSTAFDDQVIYLLSLVTKNKKRKVSSIPRDEFIDLLCKYVASTSPEVKLQLLQQARIERGFIFSFLNKYLSKLQDFLPIYTEWSTTTNAADKLRLAAKLKVVASRCATSVDGAYLICANAPDYLKLAYEFRNSIVIKYSRYAFRQARAACASKPYNDFQDTWHNFLAAVTKALDKYDSSKGALTSYVNWWILNFQISGANHGHEYGIAYSIPQHRKKQVANTRTTGINFSVSLDATPVPLDEYSVTDADDLIDSLSAVESESSMLALIKAADSPLGLARLYLDIAEQFTEEEQSQMLKIMEEQLGNCKQ